jgi:hypothetical protein
MEAPMDTSPKQQAEHQHNAKVARCLAHSILGRIVSDEWEALKEAERDGYLPEMIHAYIEGEDIEHFNMRFPELANSGILEDVVDTYIRRVARRLEPADPSSLNTLGYSKSPTLEVAAKSQRENPEALEAAFRQYMALKGAPRVPRPTVSRVVE